MSFKTLNAFIFYMACICQIFSHPLYLPSSGFSPNQTFGQKKYNPNRGPFFCFHIIEKMQIHLNKKLKQKYFIKQTSLSKFEVSSVIKSGLLKNK
jgi:hypothetical protein